MIPNTRFKRRKKAQAAMDFLFTYGWAFLALLVIIGALFYFGVGDVKKFMPDRCVFLSGLNCLDVQVIESDNITYPSTMRLAIRNEFGFDIANMSIWINGTCDSVMNLTGEIAPTSLQNKENGIFGFACLNLEGVDIKEVISVDFTNTQTGVTHRKVGYINVNQ